MPDTISITSSARAATYWFIQPCMSVNFRCSSFSEVPPIPISLVTKMKVASCAVKRSNSAFTAASARSVSECRSKKKLVHHKVMQSIRTIRPSPQPVAAEFFLLFDVCPFRPSAFLMPDYPLAEFFVPDACCGKINGSGRELECQLFRIGAFAGTCSSGDEYDSFHWYLVCILKEYLCFPEQK